MLGDVGLSGVVDRALLFHCFLNEFYGVFVWYRVALECGDTHDTHTAL